MDNEFWGMQQAYYKAQRKELEDLRKENAELKANNVELIKSLSFLRDVLNNNGYATTHTDSVIAKAKGK